MHPYRWIGHLGWKHPLRTALVGSLLSAAIALLLRSCDDTAITVTGAPTEPSPAERPEPSAGETMPERQPVAELPVVDAATPPQPPPVASTETPDLAVRDWLTVRVVDIHQVPIRDAALSLDGLRKRDDGSWYGMRGDASKAKTDAEGRARIDYTRWVDIDGKASACDLTITHPEFIVFRDSQFAIGAEERTVVLQRGAMVRLTAWCRTRSLLVRDIHITTDWATALPDDAWRREPDGTCSTTRIAPGKHLVQVRHASQELGRVESRIVAFTLPPDQRLLDVDVELRPVVTLRGRLDPAVPRPIVDGHVMLCLHARAEDRFMATEHEARIAPDGSFVVADVAEGSGQLIAWCPGWVSHDEPRPAAEVEREIPDFVTGEDRSRFLAERLENDRGPPTVRDSAAQDLVVAMQRTAVVEVRVTDLDGAPLAGCKVVTSPNVFWRYGASSIFPWGTWEATTGRDGIARIRDLPPDPDLLIGIDSASHQLQRADRDHTPRAPVRSGETTHHTLAVERKGP